MALLDRDDHWHRPCVDAFAELYLPLVTSTAVLTELFHLVGDHVRDVRAAWDLLARGTVTVSPIEDLDLPAIRALMRTYADRPMDFADATLVHLAVRDSLTTVFTVDHNDFATYRIGTRKRFRIVPASRLTR